jgi:type 1 fimbria pilin
MKRVASSVALVMIVASAAVAAPMQETVSGKVLDTACYAAQDDTRVLSLGESALRELMAEDPVAAGKLLLNLSKLLCYKLLRGN